MAPSRIMTTARDCLSTDHVTRAHVKLQHSVASTPVNTCSAVSGPQQTRHRIQLQQATACYDLLIGSKSVAYKICQIL